MNWKSSVNLVLVLVLSAFFVLAGCGSNSSNNASSNTGSGNATTDSGSNSTSTDNSKSSDTSSSNSSTDTTTASAPATGKPLVIVPSPSGDFQENFNPFSTNATVSTQGLIYEPLFYFSNVGSDIYPVLGKDYSWDSTNTKLTINLNENAVWSDGQPVTADDVLFTFNAMKQYPAADLSGIWKEVKSITKTGDHQIVMEFNKVDVPFQLYPLQTYIVPQHIWKDLGDVSKVVMKDPVGSGPYVLSSFTPQIFKLKLNDKYYGQKPAVPELDYPSFSGNDSADLALAKGEIDWSGIMIPNIKQVYTSKSPNNKYWFPPNNMVMLYTNLKNPLLSDLNVRKAISAAINRDQLSTQAEYGYEPVASPTGLILPNNNDWVDPNLPDQYKAFKQDPAAAEKFLQDAGYKKGSDGIYAKDGKKLSFTLDVVTGWSDWVTICQLVSQQLKAIGIEAKVQQLQYADYIDHLQNQRDYELAISWTNTGPSPYYQYENWLDSKASWNLEQFKSAEADQALADFAGTTDQAKQKEAIYKLQNIAATQLPGIPLLYGATWYEYNDSKYTGWPDADHAYANPAPFSWPAPAIVLQHLKPVQ